MLHTSFSSHRLPLGRMYAGAVPHMRAMEQSQYYTWLPGMEMQAYDMSMLGLETYFPQQPTTQAQAQAQAVAMMTGCGGGSTRVAGQVAAAGHLQAQGPPADLDETVSKLIQDVRNIEKREQALLELSKWRECMPDLAPVLWHSYGTMVALIQEVLCVYPQLSPPPSLTAPASNRVCNSLTLLQCIALHPDTRPLFLKAHIPLLLYPFLNTVSKDRAFEYLRLTSLGVIGALVKVDDADVIKYLLQTEIIPLCLRIMETGTDLAKTVATVIVQKLLLDDMGLTYMCATGERYNAVSLVLSKMTSQLGEQCPPSTRLLKHVIRCYLRLSENPRARESLRHQLSSDGAGGHHFLVQALRLCLPESLGPDPSLQQLPQDIAEWIREDVTTRHWLQKLLLTLEMARETSQHQAVQQPTGPQSQAHAQAHAQAEQQSAAVAAAVAAATGRGGGTATGPIPPVWQHALAAHPQRAHHGFG